MSGLPFTFSSNARSVEPIGRRLHPRGSQCCVALIVLGPRAFALSCCLGFCSRRTSVFRLTPDVTGRRDRPRQVIIASEDASVAMQVLPAASLQGCRDSRCYLVQRCAAPSAIKPAIFLLGFRPHHGPGDPSQRPTVGKYDRTHHREAVPISPVKLRSLAGLQNATAVQKPKASLDDAFELAAGSETLSPTRNASETLTTLGRTSSPRCTEEETGFSTKD